MVTPRGTADFIVSGVLCEGEGEGHGWGFCGAGGPERQTSPVERIDPPDVLI